MGYVIFRTEKIKNRNTLGRVYKHNCRMDFCDNADISRYGQDVVLISKGTTYEAYLDDRIASSKVYSEQHKTLRKDAVLAIDTVISVSKDEMETNPDFEVGQFATLAKEWLIEIFGEPNIAGSVLHMDESAPHIHTIIIPMTEDGRMCCSDFIGSPQKLRDLQTSLADKTSCLSLKRGLPNSQAKHKSIKEFYGQILEAQTSSLPDVLDGESVTSYKIRADIEHEKARNKCLKDIEALKAERQNLEKQIAETERLNKENEKLRKEIFAIRKKYKKEWATIDNVIDRHVLPEKDEKRLVGMIDLAYDTYTEKYPAKEQAI